LTHARAILPLIIVAAGLSPLALNILVPVMPELQKLFGVSYGTAELTLSLYLLAFALGQFFVGPLSDVYGRRPVMLVGLGAFALGNIMCALATDINWLIIGRVVQAFGGATGFVLSRAMLRDLYSREKAAAMLSIVVGLMVVAPMFAPAIGGFTAKLFGWQAIFYILLSVTSVFLAVCYFKLPETNLNPMGKLDLGKLGRNYAMLLKMPAMRGYILLLGFSSAMFFSFLAGGSYIVIEVMGFPATTYGIWFMLTSLGYMAGNLLSSKLVERLGTNRLITIGNLIGVLATGLLLVLSFAGLMVSPIFLFLPMLLVTFSNGLVISNATASAISIRPEIAGAGSGLTGGTQLIIAALISNLVAHIQNGSVLPTLIIMFICALLAKLMMVYTQRHVNLDGSAKT